MEKTTFSTETMIGDGGSASIWREDVGCYPGEWIGETDFIGRPIAYQPIFGIERDP